jgi:hypothetical protein
MAAIDVAGPLGAGLASLAEAVVIFVVLELGGSMSSLKAAGRVGAPYATGGMPCQQCVALPELVR